MGVEVGDRGARGGGSHLAAHKVAKACIQCQACTDCDAQWKTSSTIMSNRPWNTLSIGIVGPLPPDRRMEYVITFVDCFSKYSILIPSKDHTVQTVSNALLDQAIPYFDIPRRFLLDRGQDIWDGHLNVLDIQ